MYALYTLFLYYFIVTSDCGRTMRKYDETRPLPKYDNSNYMRERLNTTTNKPLWNEAESTQTHFEKPFHPAWMDYCDPYHCNDYHKPACGLNRRKMRFKWFQSGCHIAMNNYCANYRGNIKYDMIDPKHCVKYVLFLRMGCPTNCDHVGIDPICGISGVDNHVVLFRSRCDLEAANCRSGILQEYEEVDMELCGYLL